MAAWLAAQPAETEVRPVADMFSGREFRLTDSFRQGVVALLAGMVMGAFREGLPCRN